MHDIVLIGAGRIGRIHARNAALNPRLRLAGIVDPVDAAAQALATEWNTAVTTLDQALADPAVAGVVIASSTDTHLEYSLRAAAAGKAVFCEKPIDQDLARARSAARELSAARLLLAFNRRFDPNFQALKARLDGGSVGSLETLQITSNDPSPPPPAYVAISGGLFKDMAIHDFDMARWLLGEEVETVQAAASVLVDPAIGAAGDIDSANVILVTASGRQAVITNSRRAAYGYDQRVEALGDKGMAISENRRPHEMTLHTASFTDRAEPLLNFFIERYREAFDAEISEFVAAIEEKRAPSVGFEDGRLALVLAEAALKSITEGRVVAVKEVA